MEKPFQFQFIFPLGNADGFYVLCFLHFHCKCVCKFKSFSEERKGGFEFEGIGRWGVASICQFMMGIFIGVFRV
jgi:hypothetical protein